MLPLVMKTIKRSLKLSNASVEEAFIGSLILIDGTKLYVPQEYREDPIKNLYQSYMSAETIWNTVGRIWWWYDLKKQLVKVEKGSQQCQENKMSKLKPDPIVPDDVAEIRVMERVAIYVFYHASNHYIALVDWASSYLLCREVKRETTEEMTKVLTEWFSTYGFPVILHSDGDPCFHEKFQIW